MFRLSEMYIFSVFGIDATTWLCTIFSLLWVTVASQGAAEMSGVSLVRGFVATPKCRHSAPHVDAYGCILVLCALSTGDNPRRSSNSASYGQSSVSRQCLTHSGTQDRIPKWNCSLGEPLLALAIHELLLHRSRPLSVRTDHTTTFDPVHETAFFDCSIKLQVTIK